MPGFSAPAPRVARTARAQRRLGVAAFAVASLLTLAACSGDRAPALADGTWIAVPESLDGSPGAIRAVHLESGAERRLGPEGVYRSLAWSPAGDLLAAVSAAGDPRLVIIPVDGRRAVREVAIDSVQADLSWSPDGLRLAAVSDSSVLVFSPDLEPVDRFELPAGLPPLGPGAPGLWAPEGRQFAVTLQGYLLLALPPARWLLISPRDFVRYPGQTSALTVTDWTGRRLLDVFEQSPDGRSTRYTLDISEEPPLVTASSDYQPGAGPFDAIVAGAARAAGGRATFLGRRPVAGLPYWAVAEPAESAGLPVMLVERGDEFAATPAAGFRSAGASAIAAHMALLVVGEPSGD